jgi:hypothetical protein
MPTKKTEEQQEKTPEQLQAELEAAQAEIAALATETAALRQKVTPNDNTGKVIRGFVEVDLETPDGSVQKKKLRYKPGQVRTRLEDGQVVDSQALMDLANGKTLSAEVLKANPSLQKITPLQAVNRFQKWAEKQVGLFDVA